MIYIDIYVYMYMHIYIYMCLYMYIYIERERGRERPVHPQLPRISQRCCACGSSSDGMRTSVLSLEVRMGDIEDMDVDGGDDYVPTAPSRLKCLSSNVTELDSAGVALSGIEARGGSISAMLSKGFLKASVSGTPQICALFLQWPSM